MFSNDLFLALFRITSPELFPKCSFPFQSACLTSAPGCSAYTKYVSYWIHLLPSQIYPFYSIFYLCLPFSQSLKRTEASSLNYPNRKGYCCSQIPYSYLFLKDCSMSNPPTLTLIWWCFWWKGCQQIWHMPHSLRSTAHFCWLSASSSLTIPTQGLPLQPGSRNEKTKQSQATPGKSQAWHVL